MSRTIALLAVFGLMVVAAPAFTFASTGGVSSTGGTSTGGGGSTTPPSTTKCNPGKKGKIVKGSSAYEGDRYAIPPCGAPSGIRAKLDKLFAAANHIRSKPYVWGGGHAHWSDRGYDCSGAVSYALHGAKLLKPDRAYDSGEFARRAHGGKGKWITTYGNGGHVYMVVAGLRWDTSMHGRDRRGSGPGWSSQMRSSKGFHARHPGGY